MSHWQKIRDAAEDLRLSVHASSGGEPNSLQKAGEVLEKVVDHLDLICIPEHPESANLRGALAVLEDDCIYFDNTLTKWYRTYCVAHEVAHFVLHHHSVHCSRTDIEDFSGDEDGSKTAEAAVGYGAGERREREANLFALELLLPVMCLRGAFVEQKLSASEIAGIVKMPVDVIAGQLARAVLVPAADQREIAAPSESRDLDDSQRSAAESKECPLLVSAGPGTGKTQTLTGRISHLLGERVDPKRILALTFSTRAAAEMRERVDASNPGSASRMQIMTFHSFGLDILRRYWKEVDLEPTAQLIDPIDAVLYLERHLEDLKLEYYQELHDPTLRLPKILSAISRAKDELCDPVTYRDLAEKMLSNAVDEEGELKAKKALEVARVYQFYQDHLDREKLLDFGDLIFKAVRLLQSNDLAKREMQSRFDAILVDEFQDVNRACGVLLREVAGDGESLWAVGDLRQSIYRWRGASPANIMLFDRDFPNAKTKSLEINYRSKGQIVDLFANFAGRMTAGGGDFFHDWKPKHGKSEGADARPITFGVARSILAEGKDIAKRISHHLDEGILFKDQAVVCRTRGQLREYAQILSNAGIPVFYLGDIFERDEVRDLLSLLDLRHNTNGFALVRVARFPEYAVPLDDVLCVITQIAMDQSSLDAAVAACQENGKLSEEGKVGLRKLLGHLSSAEDSVWEFLINYLFNESEFLRAFLMDPDVHNQTQMLAIYQFIRFAEDMSSRFTGPDHIPAFLRHVRTLVSFDEDKNYAQIPAAAENLDAVRLLTVHACKGLEFPVVYLPRLGKGMFPHKRMWDVCPDPEGLSEIERDHHDEEEECLFFVAMSRARDFLHLTRSERYGDQNSNESPFLAVLSEALPPKIKIDGEGAEGESAKELNGEPPEYRKFYARELDAYLRCPRQYYYKNVLGLKAENEKGTYLRFHTCVHETIRSLQALSINGSAEIAEDIALAQLDTFWTDARIDDHPYAPLYKSAAIEMIRRALPRLNGFEHQSQSLLLDVHLKNTVVRVNVDPAKTTEADGAKRFVNRKYETKKVSKNPKIKAIDALIVHALEQEYPDHEIIMQHIYLADDSVRDIEISKRIIKNRLNDYEQAASNIYLGLFPPEVGDECPRCSYFFICPSGK